MTEQKLGIILHELTEIKTGLHEFKSVVLAEIKQLKADVAGLKADVADLKSEMVQVKADIVRIDNRLKVMYLQMSLIEQRLCNMERWISANNKHLHFDTARHTAA